MHYDGVPGEEPEKIRILSEALPEREGFLFPHSYDAQSVELLQDHRDDGQYDHSRQTRQLPAHIDAHQTHYGMKPADS